MSTVGERLREVRQGMKLSQTEFGKLGGVLKQAQLKYEKGDRMPDAIYFEALGKAGVDVRYVVTGQQMTEAERRLEERLSHVRKATAAAIAIPGLNDQQQAAVQAAVFQARMAPLPADEQQLLGHYRQAGAAGKAAILATAASLATTSSPMSPPKPPKGPRVQQTFHGSVDQVAGKNIVNKGPRKR